MLMTSKPRFGFVLEYVADVDAVKRFCVDVLGLEVEREHPTLVQFRDQAGAAFAIASDESLSGRNDPELYWVVDDAEVAFRDLAGTVAVGLPLTEKPFGKVFSVTDPAGQPHFLLEFARNRPSQRMP